MIDLFFNAPLYIYGSPIDKGAFSLRLRSKTKETRMALCSLLKLLIDTRQFHLLEYRIIFYRAKERNSCIHTNHIYACIYVQYLYTHTCMRLQSPFGKKYNRKLLIDYFLQSFSIWLKYCKNSRAFVPMPSRGGLFNNITAFSLLPSVSSLPFARS